jgi:hypothetical protein
MMWDQIGIAVVASLFTYLVAAALWSREFTYRFGPTIRRRERPIEYWAVTLLFLAVTCLLWTILLLISTGYLHRWKG